MEKIEEQIEVVQKKIDGCKDRKEMKHLWKEKEQLREKELILLRRGDLNAPALLVPSVSIAVHDPLTMFWSYIIGDRTIESGFKAGGMVYGDAGTVEEVKTIAFKGHDDPTKACAKWGPSFMFSVLVERSEYVRCWDLMRSGNLKYILLRGTKGVGKSVFIYWLIYKIIQAAKATVSKHNLPTILLITSGDTGGKLYRLLSVVDGVAVMHRLTSVVSADYVLSDVEFDPAVATTHWNLNVVSFGAIREPDIFNGIVCDAKEAGMEMIMEPCSLEEIQAMSGRAHTTTATFSYAVFGGSARMASMLNSTSVIGGTEEVADVAKQELREYFADSEYSDSGPLFDQAALVIAKMVATTALRSGQTDESQAKAVQHSLFIHTYLNKDNTKGGGYVRTIRTIFASTFMSILAGVLVEREELSVLKHLRNILTGSGQGILFEAQVHKTLYEKFKLGGDLRLTRMYPTSDYTKKATDKELEKVRITVNKKVLIRTTGDIARLKDNEYGMPIITNFPLVDAVIKTAECGIELQVTIAEAHTGALHKHEEIESKMGTPSEKNMMIFCCSRDNFDAFGYVEGLVRDVKQYKMLCEWEADPSNPVKKRRCGGRK